MAKKKSAQEKAFAAAFTEWDRRYREEPERFLAESVHLIRGNPKSYGDSCSPYFMSILKEQKAKPRRKRRAA